MIITVQSVHLLRICDIFVVFIEPIKFRVRREEWSFITVHTCLTSDKMKNRLTRNRSEPLTIK